MEKEELLARLGHNSSCFLFYFFSFCFFPEADCCDRTLTAAGMMPHCESRMEAFIKENREIIEMNRNFTCPLCKLSVAYIATPGSSETNLGNVRKHYTDVCYPAFRLYVKNEVSTKENKVVNDRARHLPNRAEPRLSSKIAEPNRTEIR